MKILPILVFLGSLCVFSAAWAQNDISPPVQPNTGTWIFQIDGETGFPTGRLNNAADEGWGPEGSFGYRFPQNIALSLETGYMGYAAKNGMLNTTWNLLPILLKCQYNFGNANIQPYLFIGAGIALNYQSSFFAGSNGAVSEVDFLEEAGLGVSFALLTQTYLFIQSKVEVDDTSGRYAGDQPTVLIPIDVGLNILVN